MTLTPSEVRMIRKRAEEAHQQNLDAAQREIDRRAAEGEDVSDLVVDAKTYAVVRRERPKVLPLRAGAFDWWDNPCPRRGF
jgi:hypothetical protein